MSQASHLLTHLPLLLGNDEAEHYVARLGSEIDRDCEGLIEFIAESPSAYHAAYTAASIFEAAGFREQDLTADWSAAPGGHFMRRDGAVLAWWIPVDASPSTSGFHIVGAHTDSPGLKLKPVSTDGYGKWSTANVETYGGPLLYTWFDRELELAGRVICADGSEHLIRTGPLLYLPSLAIHLNRKANESLTIDSQAHLRPVISHGHQRMDLNEILSELVLEQRAATANRDIDVDDASADSQIVAHDLIAVAAQRGDIGGALGEFLAAARLDNLSSVYAGLHALIDATNGLANADDDARNGSLPGPHIPVFVAFDHEEIGSNTTTGAAGPLLEEALSRITAALGANYEHTRQMCARSVCVSADAAHAVHPNFPEVHDSAHQPMLGAGPVIKYNAKARYATDAYTAGVFIRSCELAGVPYQQFVSDNRMPCGSTIGPITATRLGIPTVDVGVPMLAMHSAREMCGTADVTLLRRALTAFYLDSAS